MRDAKVTPAACCQSELRIEISAPPEFLWNAIFASINEWWLPDFRAVGSDSLVTFDPLVGGRGLAEENPAGDCLLWYSVQMHQPSQRRIYLIGHIAAEWGGPSTSSLKLAVDSSDSGSVLTIADARHGNVNEQDVQSYVDGWKQLFTDGLKAFVEQTFPTSLA